jgi:peptidoglycan/LPS O-acetylase OafA/YrhL
MPEMNKRIPALDGVRGLAIILVVISHAGIGALASGGRVGVTLFFVLSGYLITRLLLIEQAESGSIRIAAFYGRRALRLLPALVLYLVGIALLMWWLRLDVPVWRITWPPALYVANYAEIMGMDLFAHRHTWSLAVEEHFYLIWPVVVAAGATKRLRPLAVVVALLLVWRLVVASFNPYWAYRGSDTNAYALGFGCLLAVADMRRLLPRLPRSVPAIATASLLLLGTVPVESAGQPYLPAVWLPPLAAALAVVLIAGAVQHDFGLLRSDVLRWFGLISYSLYLWHAPLMQLPGLGDSALGRLVSAAVAVVLAWGSWVFVERRFVASRWREALAPVRQRSPSAEAI